MVTGLLLVAAVLAFAGLIFVPVPMSTTQTITQTGVSYSPYVETNIAAYTSTSIQFSYTSSFYLRNPTFPSQCQPVQYLRCSLLTTTTTWYVSGTQTLQSTYEAIMNSTVPYGQTLTESSTSDAPASAALGLADGSFAVLAVGVIGILAVLTAYLMLKPKTTHRPKQATLVQFTMSPSACIKCGAKLPPASEFCNKCGTRQTG
jgi:ribosomal protein L40E